jgi:hypothetical protein
MSGYFPESEAWHIKEYRTYKQSNHRRVFVDSITAIIDQRTIIKASEAKQNT